MKKIIASIVLTVVVMGVLCNAVITRVEREYEAKLEEALTKCEDKNSEYEDLVSDYSKLESEHKELSEQVYNYFNDQPYEISIKHDDEHHTWYATKRGLFSNGSHMITTFASSLTKTEF